MAAQFTKIRLTNWRNFRNAQAPLGRRALLFGPNAAGKSNLLDALRFLRDVARPGAGLGAAVDARGADGLRCLHAPAGVDFKIDVEAELHGERWRYALSVAVDKQGGARVKGESLEHDRLKILRRPTQDDRRDPQRLSQTYIEQSCANAAFRTWAEFLASVAEPAPGLDALSAELLRCPRRQRDARLRRVSEQLRVALPRLDRMTFEADDRGQPRLTARFERGRSAVCVRGAQLSRGTIHLTCLLWAASAGQGPLLLEEPELAVHPEAVGQLLELLAGSGGAGRQLLVATHAERLVDDARVDPSEILLLNPTAEGTVIEVAAADTVMRSSVASEQPLGGLVAARTSPANAEQMALYFGET